MRQSPMPRESDCHHGDGRDLDRKIHEVKRRRFSIDEHSENPRHASTTHAECHQQQTREGQFAMAKAPDKEAAHANCQASIDRADLSQGAGYHGEPGLLGERRGCDYTRETREQDEGSIEGKNDTGKRHQPSLRDGVDLKPDGVESASGLLPNVVPLRRGAPFAVVWSGCDPQPAPSTPRRAQQCLQKCLALHCCDWPVTNPLTQRLDRRVQYLIGPLRWKRLDAA